MVDAAYRIPGSSHVMIWSATRYARIQCRAGDDDSMISGPLKIRDRWPSLNKSNIGRVDAVCPVPGNNRRIYVFSGAKYVKLELNPDTLVDTLATEPTPITDGWKTLGRAGFDRIDAAMVVPGTEDNIYFFRGKEWIDVSWTDQLISHGTIAESWPSLKKAEFETVDAILKNEDDTYYFFSGDRYARIRMKQDEDTLYDDGPYHISRWNTFGNWA
ncbi:hypothetical protein MW887_011555 [Aspergillus wentii]|nr:hypothetical protein MW887_011555 [Aspergillus wentii]